MNVSPELLPGHVLTLLQCDREGDAQASGSGHWRVLIMTAMIMHMMMAAVV